MKSITVGIAAILALGLALPCGAQDEYWTLLEEYPSPANYALGLYYDGKLLWHVDWDSSQNIHTVYTLNPYNMQVIETFASPVTQPWGITFDGTNYWMTSHGTHGQPTAQLCKIDADSFIVDTTFTFPGYYFYGITCDTSTGNIWVASQTTAWVKWFLEFNPGTGQVVEWHHWPWTWTVGLHWFQGNLWANTYDYFYPDHTYIVDVDTWTIQNILIPPYACPEGIATNGLVWWISYWRYNHHCIQKLVPPGVTIHDIAAHTIIEPPGGILPDLSFIPIGRFVNYGSCDEEDVPFLCMIIDDSNEVVYYDSIVYEAVIQPDQIVDITYAQATLEPSTDYKVKFYSNLDIDQYRSNDSMHVYITTPTFEHDLAVLSILEPDSLEPFAAIYPLARVQNLGNLFEPVAPVQLQVRHEGTVVLNVQAPATNLSPGEIDTVAFPPFMPAEEGEYTFFFDGLLPLDSNPVNDSVTVVCLVGPTHDVAPVQVTSPPSSVSLGVISPRAIVRNLGDFDETVFNVFCTIGNSGGYLYAHLASCPPLAPGQQFEVAFPNFSFTVPDFYTVSFITMLSGDMVPENDSLGQVTQAALVLDVAPTAVLSPPPTVVPGVYNPTAIITNVGNYPAESFTVTCQADSGSQPYFLQETILDGLSPGEADTVTFAAIPFSNTQVSRLLFIADWELDQNPDNDTLVYYTQPPSGVTGGNASVTGFQVAGCFPNPFNASTCLRVHLPVESPVKVDLYSLDGRRVLSRDCGSLPAGIQTVVLEADDLPSAVYIVHLRAGKWQQSQKIALLK